MPYSFDAYLRDNIIEIVNNNLVEEGPLKSNGVYWHISFILS